LTQERWEERSKSRGDQERESGALCWKFIQPIREHCCSLVFSHVKDRVQELQKNPKEKNKEFSTLYKTKLTHYFEIPEPLRLLSHHYLDFPSTKCMKIVYHFFALTIQISENEQAHWNRNQRELLVPKDLNISAMNEWNHNHVESLAIHESTFK
jgi:hypothetical protein